MLMDGEEVSGDDMVKIIWESVDDEWIILSVEGCVCTQ